MEEISTGESQHWNKTSFQNKLYQLNQYIDRHMFAAYLLL